MEGLISNLEALNKVTMGLKEPGPMYKNLLTPQPMSFTDGYPAVFTEKRWGEPVKMSPITDVWNARRANGSMK